MTRGRERLAFRAAAVAGSVALGCVALLVADYAWEVSRTPGTTSRIETLEKEVKTDPAIATELHETRDRWTEASLGRKARARGAAWVLLFAGGLFVVAGKWYTALRPERVPSLDDLVAARFAPDVAPRGTAPASARTTGNGSIDPAFVDELVARHGRDREATIPILQAIQDHCRYLPDEALRRVCERTDITAAQIAGTSSFYAQFRRSPVGRHVVRVCHGTACHVAGAQRITDELKRHLRIAPEADTDPERRFTLDTVACVGCCSLAPVMMIEERTAGRLTPASARQQLDALEPPS